MQLVSGDCKRMELAMLSIAACFRVGQGPVAQSPLSWWREVCVGVKALFVVCYLKRFHRRSAPIQCCRHSAKQCERRQAKCLTSIATSTRTCRCPRRRVTSSACLVSSGVRRTTANRYRTRALKLRYCTLLFLRCLFNDSIACS